MSGLEEASPTVRRTIFVTVVCYFAVFIYASVAGDPIAMAVADALFGFIAIGVGAVLLAHAASTVVLNTAAACLIVGGLTQFAWIVTRLPVFSVSSTVTVFVGIGLYIYAVWGEN